MGEDLLSQKHFLKTYDIEEQGQNTDMIKGKMKYKYDYQKKGKQKITYVKNNISRKPLNKTVSGSY